MLSHPLPASSPAPPPPPLPPPFLPSSAAGRRGTTSRRRTDRGRKYEAVKVERAVNNVRSSLCLSGRPPVSGSGPERARRLRRGEARSAVTMQCAEQIKFPPPPPLRSVLLLLIMSDGRFRNFKWMIPVAMLRPTEATVGVKSWPRIMYAT